MSQGGKICVFSLSKKDPTFRCAVSINGPIEWLKGKKNPPHNYYFRTIAPGSLPSGSKILFSFENQIFGEAIIKEGVRFVMPKDNELPETFSGIYKQFITLDPASILIYKFHPTKSELLENGKFADYQFSQLFSYLSLEQYAEILKIAKR
jgi:hypothetical protein